MRFQNYLNVPSRSAVMVALVLMACSGRSTDSGMPRSKEALQQQLAILLRSAEGAGPQTIDEIATTYWALGELEAAELWMKRGLATDAGDAALNINLAQVLAQRGRYLEALPYCRAFLKAERSENQHRLWARDLVSVAEAVMRPAAKGVWSITGDTGTDTLGMAFIRIPGGRFEMGSGRGPSDSRPPHVVELSPFWIGRAEVTLGQYQEFLRVTGYTPDGSPPFTKRPGISVAVSVSWRDARAFSIWMSSREQVTYRLPSEAEWEFAARGTDGRLNPWGNEPGAPGLHGNWGRLRRALEQDSLPATEKVGTYPAGASPFGLVDMAGNAREWCLDLYGSDYYTTAPLRDPFGPMSSSRHSARTLRGSGWRDSLETGHAIVRYKADSNQPYDSFGFRLVREVDSRTPSAEVKSGQ